MDGNKKVTRSRGEHLKKDIVKTEIIGYILSKDGIVPGPDIIKHLRKKFNIVDEKNIRIHLKDLQNQHSIEKIPHEPGLENKWKIEKVENLRSIQKHYPDIQLNKYDKSLDIIFSDQHSKGYSFGGYLDGGHLDNRTPISYLDTFIQRRDLRIQLSLSNSFFYACLDKDIKTLCDEAYEYYKYGEGFEEFKHAQNCIDKFYNECIERISVSPNIWLDIYNMDTNNFSGLEISQNNSINLPNIEISKETFREILEDSQVWRFDSNDWELRFIEEFSLKLTDMIYQKMLDKTPSESNEIWEKELKTKSQSILREMLAEIPTDITSYNKKQVFFKMGVKEILALRLMLLENQNFGPNFVFFRDLVAKITYELFQQVVKEIPKEHLDMQEIFILLDELLKKILQEVLKKILIEGMYKILIEVLVHRTKTGYLINKIIFKHYFDRDIEDGTVSFEEREYIVMRNNLQADVAEEKIKKRHANFALDQFFKDYIKNT